MLCVLIFQLIRLIVTQMEIFDLKSQQILYSSFFCTPLYIMICDVFQAEW
jgi:hypothetical protein